MGQVSIQTELALSRNRILYEIDHDHLGLLSLGIDKESMHFEPEFLHLQVFRQLFPTSTLANDPPYSSPPTHIPLRKGDRTAISSQIGLLRPFLEAREATDHALYDDDDLPETETTVAQQARRTIAAKPDVPFATGRVVLGKRKKEAAVTAAAITAAPVINPVGLNLTTQLSAAIKAAVNAGSEPAAKKAKTTSSVQLNGAPM